MEFRGKKKWNPKTDDTEVVLLYFLLPKYIKKRLTVVLFFNIMQFEQVGTGQECPLTSVWNIPQVNWIIIKKKPLIVNQEASLDGSISRFFYFHYFAQILGLFL